MKNIDIVNEIFEKTGGQNVADLISEFENNYKFNIELKYKDIYKKNDKIIIKVYDNVTESPFELYYDENTNKLKIY